MDITEKLETIKHRWEEMGEQLADPAVASDMKKFVKLNKDYKDLEPIVMAFKEYKTLKTNVEEAKEMISVAKQFNIASQIIGHVEALEPKRLTINSKFGTFEY